MNEEQKNNPTKQGTARETLTNTMQGLAQPKPGLVFLFTLFLLNYKFWLVVFGEGSVEGKINLIAYYYSLEGGILQIAIILLLKVVIAFVVSITYPAIINCTKWFYAKKISKIPTDVNEEYIREKQELNNKINHLKEESKRKDYQISLLNNNIRQLLEGMDDDKLLEISRNIEIYGENIYGPNTYLDANTLSKILFIKLNSNEQRIYMLRLFLDVNDAFKDITLQSITKTEDIKTKFKIEIEEISQKIDLKNGRFDKFKDNLTNYNYKGLAFVSSIVSYFTSNLGSEFYILGYFIIFDESSQRKLNIQGQLVLAKALHNILEEVKSKTEEEKQIILSLLPDLKEYGKNLEEILQNLFRE